MAGLVGDERLVVTLLIGLSLATGALLWWQGHVPGLGLDWERANVEVGTGAGDSAGTGADGVDAGGATINGFGDTPAQDAPVGPPVTDVPLTVHVAGAVANPGVYSLPPGSRVIDAVNAAGGVTAAAEPNAVNLARPLADGERFYMPTKEEVRRSGWGWLPVVDGTGVVYSGGSGSWPTGGSGSAQSSVTGGTLPAGLKLNINTATSAQLEALPGIGPTLAARIVEYRSRHGPFRAVEELLNVSGIGDKKLEEVRALITIQ